MYLPDLSNLFYGHRANKRGEHLNVGWLAFEYDYPMGDVAPEIVEKLKTFPIVNLCRGFHVCEFCNDVNGNGEIHVTASNGQVYRAPYMLIHYIVEHRYLPPEEFLKAVEEAK